MREGESKQSLDSERAAASSVRESLAPKDGDVYRFSYSEAERQRANGHDLHWCFDGQLVFRRDLLVDTYWGLNGGGSDGRSFTVAEAQGKGTLTFVCNLNDVENIRPDEFPLYAEGDAFNLSHQHSCYKHFVRRAGAKKDADLMRAAVYRKVRDAHEELARAARNLEYAVELREQLLPKIAAGEEPYI